VLRHVAAGEIGSGLLINPVVPEAAAAALRALAADRAPAPDALRGP
jgi:hypothetical protein